MKRRVFFLLILQILITTISSGCWNYREINKLSVVAGMAIDKVEQGRYMLTVEIVDLHEDGKDTRIKSKLVETYGDTMLEAIRSALKTTAPRMYWGHTEIVILSREIAQEGIIDILDLLDRDSEPRLTIDLLVSKEKTAKEILDSQSITTEIRSYEINDMLDAQAILSEAPKVEIYQFIDALSGEGISAVLPTISLTENKGLETSYLAGTAVFKEDKLAGFLDENDTKAYLFIMNKIKGGLINVKEHPEHGHPDIALEVFENRTKVKPIYQNGKVSINIDIKTETAIDEHGTSENYIDEDKNIILEHDAEEELKTSIESLIVKMQKDYGIDIFGFGRRVKEEMPWLWKNIGQDWPSIFKDMDVKVNSYVNIQNSGLLSKPISPGD